MTAPLLIGLLLIASARTAADDDGASLPHLELPANPDSGRGHGLAARAQGLMGLLSMSGCGRFAGLVAATPGASVVFEERFVADGGLTVFCPDDKAVAKFEPTFRALADSDRLAALLLHGVAARYGPALLAATEFVMLHTLAAADAATSKRQILHILQGRLWPSPPASCKSFKARIIKTASSEEGPCPVAVYLIDAVLVPCLDGEAAAGGGRRVSWLAGHLHPALGSAELCLSGHRWLPGRTGRKGHRWLPGRSMAGYPPDHESSDTLRAKEEEEEKPALLCTVEGFMQLH